MSGAKAVLVRETNCDIDDLVSRETAEQTTHSVEEVEAVKKLLLKRYTSPSITINPNGSRYIAPIDIVRSKVGRAEIQRQTSQDRKETVKKSSK